MNKTWVEDHLGKPQHFYGYRDADGKRKEIRFKIPASPDKSVDVFSLLAIVSDAERLYGEVRDVRLHWIEVAESGHGQDREAGYVQFWITFKRLETNKEFAKRKMGEEKDLKEADERAAKERAFLKSKVKGESK